MKATVHITLKKGVLDPQGQAIEHALKTLGFDNVLGARQGKYIQIDLDESDPAKATEKVNVMCEELLANTVIENYHVEIDG